MAKKIKVWNGSIWEDVTPALPVALIDHSHDGLLPSTSGNTGELLVTDGTTSSWSNTVTANTSSSVGLVVKGVASQSAALQQWQDSAGSVVASILNTGQLSNTRINVEGNSNSLPPLSVISPNASTSDIAYFARTASGFSVSITPNATVEATNFRSYVETGLATTGTVNLDFNSRGFKTQGSLTGNIIYTASNYAAGRSLTIRVVNGATQRDLQFPTNWKFVGTKPANIAASKTGILTVTSFGTTEADCVAAWAVEA